MKNQDLKNTAQNPIIEYYNKIVSGEITTSEKIKRTYKKLVSDIKDKKSQWIYDPEKANHAIGFIEKFCKHSKGEWGGQPVILELWQKAFIAALFGMVDKITGYRKYKEVFLLVARKNGKSLIASAIALYCLTKDGEAGADCYSVATKRDQAKIVWTEASKMIRKSPALKKRIKCLVNDIKYDATDSSFKPLCSDSNTLDGLNVHFASIDELHEIKDKNLYDVIVDGTSARKQPIILITTTSGTRRENIFDIKYDEATRIIEGYSDKRYIDESFLPLIYELDSREEWTDETAWIKANPNLGVSKGLDYLRRQVNKAKGNSINLKNLLTKDFNIRETSTESWLTFEQAVNESTFNIAELKPRYGIGGFDLSDTTDLTSACVLFRVPDDETIYVESMYWLPAELLEKRAQEDDVPYDLWYKQGYLRICEGNSINPQDIENWFLEVMNEKDIYLYKFGYDRWSAKYLVKNLQNVFGDILNSIAQGKQTLSGPMKQLGADLTVNKVNYGNNPITRMCLHNVSIDIDKNGNIQPAKFNPRKRIDGFAAMLNAYVVYQDNKDEYLNLI